MSTQEIQPQSYSPHRGFPLLQLPVPRDGAVTDSPALYVAGQKSEMIESTPYGRHLRFSRRHAHELQINAGVKSFPETNRKFEDSIIGSQDDDIARGVQNGGADIAVIQMLLHGIPRFVTQRSVQIFRNVVPNVLAIYNHESHLLFEVRFTVFS